MRIAVIGAGVIGLSSAIRLREAGFDVTIFAERQTPHVTSDRAGACFSAFRIAADARIERWTRASYVAFKQFIDRNGASTGLRIARAREFFFDASHGNPWWLKLVERAEPLESCPSPYAAGVCAWLPVMNMQRYMPFLRDWFTGPLQARIVSRHVAACEELLAEGFAGVVNCAGVGARALAGDPAVRAMRGQVLHVPNMLGLQECLLDEGRDGLVTYLFPFEDYVVLGGVYELDQWEERTDDATLDAIVERCRTLLSLTGDPRAAQLGATRLRALAGLRPARVVGPTFEAVRLEAEHTNRGWIVHNYGHGRVGVSLSWGCAEDVVREVMQLMGPPSSTRRTG